MALSQRFRRAPRVALNPTAGLVNKVLFENRTSSKMGTASFKAMRFVRNLIKR